MLEGVVPDEINRRTLECLKDNPGTEVGVNAYQPDDIVNEDWFVEGVIQNPQAAGAVRSLLGKNFKLPAYISNHRVECPRTVTGGWHRDGGGLFTWELNHLQVFYYPQDTPKEMGPTQLVPTTHFLRGARRFMRHYGNVRKAISTVAPAGSIFVTHYNIFHRATSSTASGIRHLLKYNYYRKTPPTRDWIVDPHFDFGAVPFRTVMRDSVHENHWNALDPARLFHWLCGFGADFGFKGGSTWPISAGYGRQQERIEGLPPGLAQAQK
jgi:hypothetical protein